MATKPCPLWRGFVKYPRDLNEKCNRNTFSKKMAWMIFPLAVILGTAQNWPNLPVCGFAPKLHGISSTWTARGKSFLSSVEYPTKYLLTFLLPIHPSNSQSYVFMKFTAQLTLSQKLPKISQGWDMLPKCAARGKIILNSAFHMFLYLFPKFYKINFCIDETEAIASSLAIMSPNSLYNFGANPHTGRFGQFWAVPKMTARGKIIHAIFFENVFLLHFSLRSLGYFTNPLHNGHGLVAIMLTYYVPI